MYDVIEKAQRQIAASAPTQLARSCLIVLRSSECTLFDVVLLGLKGRCQTRVAVFFRKTEKGKAPVRPFWAHFPVSITLLR